MRLTDFIQKNRVKIVDEWVSFAGTIQPWAKGLTRKQLQDHADELITAVVADMRSPESPEQQADKAKGLAERGALGRIGKKHALERLHSGFNLNQLVSEYRALRASILRLWTESERDQEPEVTRFNEAIDESLSEAAIWYSEGLERTRDQFLGILGHDLRNPLNAISLGASLITRAENVDDKNVRIATRIMNSAGRMDRMVADLLDLTRSRLGSGIPVNVALIDLGAVCQQVISELEIVYSDHPIRYEATGDLHGELDSDRLIQLLSNLVANSLQHGDKREPVRIFAEGEGERLEVRVHNAGQPIPEDLLKKIFEPMVRGPDEPLSGENTIGLGLGLYIALQIALAHNGTLTVTSTLETGTTFCLQLPRHQPERRALIAAPAE